MSFPRRVALALALPLVAALATFVLRSEPAAAAPPPAEAPGKFMGTAQCVKCHENGMGGRAADALPALKEVPIWQKRDQHAFAFLRLQDKRPPNPRWRSKVSSEDIMANLTKKGGDDGDDDDDDDDADVPEASKSPRCLTCHGIMVQQLGAPGWLPKGAELRVSENRALQQGYKASEGVSCDGCHGPASGWVESHVTDHWAPNEWKKRQDPKDPAAASRKLWEEKGIYYSKDLVLWARQCVRCHLQLDAELVKAEHPDLKPFELWDQVGRVPPHWRDYAKAQDAAELPGAGPTHAARLWQVGQAVALDDALAQVVARTGKKKVAKKQVEAAIERAQSHWTVLRHALAAQPSLKDAAAALGAAMTKLAGAKDKAERNAAAKAAIAALGPLPYALATVAVSKDQVKAIKAALEGDADAKQKGNKDVAELSLVPLGKALE
ncbi:MAG: hypothetical protein AB7N76_29405 [Planctomycetota bacterium]